jgi:hypothetical protein
MPKANEDAAERIQRIFEIWRSLAESKGALKNTDKTSTNQLGCFVSDTTWGYHLASLAEGARGHEGLGVLAWKLAPNPFKE